MKGYLKLTHYVDVNGNCIKVNKVIVSIQRIVVNLKERIFNEVKQIYKLLFIYLIIIYFHPAFLIFC